MSTACLTKSPLNKIPKSYTPSLLFGGFLLGYLPFLSEGYGKEFDAWSNALNARTIAETGVYEVSRLPGHPLYELLLSALYPLNHSYFFYNLLTALASAAAIYFFYKVARFYQLKNALWLSLTLGFTPVFFIAATYTIDYNFALCFLLGSWWWGLQKKPWLAGLFLALATGWRISSLGFVLPYFLLFAPYFTQRDFFKFALAAGLGSALAFLPPLLTYGPSFLDFHKPPFPTLANVLYKLSFGIWGLVLQVALALAVFLGVKRYFKGSLPDGIQLPKWFSMALTLIILMQLAVFLRLPFKSEFFIPAIPFVLMAVFIGLKPKEAKWLTLAAALSLLLGGFDYYQSWRGGEASAAAITFEAGGKNLFLDPLQGPLFLDQSKRAQKAATVKKALEKLKAKEQKCYVVAGWYWPHLVFKNEDGRHHFEHYATKAEIARAKQEGYSLYYLPEINVQNEIMEGVFLSDSLAKPLLTP